MEVLYGKNYNYYSIQNLNFNVLTHVPVYAFLAACQCHLFDVKLFVPFQVAELYKSQQQIQNQQKSEKEDVEDFY